MSVASYFHNGKTSKKCIHNLSYHSSFFLMYNYRIDLFESRLYLINPQTEIKRINGGVCVFQMLPEQLYFFPSCMQALI